jgi:hypothetical protein
LLTIEEVKSLFLPVFGHFSAVFARFRRLRPITKDFCSIA